MSDIRYAGPPPVFCNEKTQWGAEAVALAVSMGDVEYVGRCNTLLKKAGARCPNEHTHLSGPLGAEGKERSDHE